LLKCQVSLELDAHRQDSSSEYILSLERACLLIRCAQLHVPTIPSSLKTKRQMCAYKVIKMLQWPVDLLLLVYMASYLFEVPSWCWLEAHRCGDESVVMRAPLSSTLPLRLSRPLQMVCLVSLVGRTMLDAYAMGSLGVRCTASLLADIFALLDNIVAVFNHYGLPPKEIYWSPLLRPFVFLSHFQSCQRFLGDALPAMFHPAVLDLLFLQCAFLAIWAWFGLLLFGNTKDGTADEGREHFSDFHTSALSLFTLFTTANFPDIMMSAYTFSRFYFAYFCIYVVFSLYIFFNVLLAAMFTSYKQQVNRTHKAGQEATIDTLQEGFQILVDLDPDGREGFITLRTWMAFSDVYSKTPDCTWDVDSMLELFDPSYYISLEMWLLAVPELAQPTSSLRHHLQDERSGNDKQSQRALGALHLAVDVAVVLSLLCTVHQTEDLMVSKRPIFDAPWYLQAIHFTCAGLYVVEAVARRYILDHQHFSTHRVLMDMVMGVTCTVLETLLYMVGPGEPLWSRFHGEEGKLSRFLALIRVARVERVLWRFEGKRETLRVLLRLVGAFKRACAGLFFVFYLYSTVGVQIFGGRIHTKSKRLKHDYFGKEEYWANNFNDFASGLVVLFELMVVNNWYVIAQGLAMVSPVSSCVGWFFCISFYFCIHIVILNVLVASVVAGFERICEDDKAHKPNVVSDLKSATSHASLQALQEANNELQPSPRIHSPETASVFSLTLSAPIESMAMEAAMKTPHIEENSLLLERDVTTTRSQRLRKLKTLAQLDPRNLPETEVTPRFEPTPVASVDEERKFDWGINGKEESVRVAKAAIDRAEQEIAVLQAQVATEKERVNKLETGIAEDTADYFEKLDDMGETEQLQVLLFQPL